MTETAPQSEKAVAAAPIGRSAGWGYAALLAGILAVALILRIAIQAEYLARNPTADEPYQDAGVYWDWAGRIAAGQLSEPAPFLAAPLYPYFLGVVRMLGGGLHAVYGLQIGLQLLTAGLIAGAARIRFGISAALLAAAIYCALTEPASFGLRILPNTLQLLLVAALLRVIAPLAGGVDSKGKANAADAPVCIPRALTIGVLLGLLALAMPQALLLIPLVVGWLASRSGPAPATGVTKAGAALFAATVTIAPATIHNYRASGELIPITAHSGITMRQGNSPAAHGVYVTIEGVSANRAKMHDDAAKVFAETTGRNGSWGEIDAFFRGQVFAWWMSNPPAAVELFIKKAWWFLSARNYDDQFPTVLEQEFGMADRFALAPLATPWIFGAAAAGMISVVRVRRRRGAEWMLLALALVTTLIFFYTPRYRLCALPPACMLAAYAICCLQQLRIPAALAICLCAAPLGMELLNRGVFTIDDGRRIYPFDSPSMNRMAYATVLGAFHSRAGDRLLAAGDVEGARRWYERALEIGQEAAQRSKLAAPPTKNAAALRQLGAIHLEHGDVDAAARLIEESLIFDATHAPSLLRMYNICTLRSRVGPADDYLARACELDPANAEGQLARAWLTATSREPLLRNFLTAQECAARAIDAAGPTVVAQRPEFYDVLAAAQAAADKYEEAIATAEKAIAIARTNGDHLLVKAIEERVQSYRDHQPWRADPRLARVPLLPDPPHQVAPARDAVSP